MTPKKILIVDDDRDLIQGMSVWLRSQGYQTVFAVDAASAVLMTQSEKPDLLILDLSLPAGGGYHVMKSLRSSMAMAAIPIIVITAGDESINRERALAAGAEAFFQKPFESEELLMAIENALGKKARGEPAADSTKGTILIIEDDKDLLRGLLIRLRSQGYTVHTAVDGVSSIGLALKVKPDLIIVDISLPGGDGYQTMTRLRALMPIAHIPIFVITAGNASIHRERAFKAGAEAFFQKPLENERFLAAIQKVVGG